jgi:hypothetical protein
MQSPKIIATLIVTLAVCLAGVLSAGAEEPKQPAALPGGQ